MTASNKPPSIDMEPNENLANIGDECSICKETFLAAVIKSKLKCAHEFHTHCINKWLLRRNTCPICRERVRDGGEEESGNDSENGEEQFVETPYGFRVPRYRGEFRYDRRLKAYISPEVGICMYLLILLLKIGATSFLVLFALSLTTQGWRIIFPDSVSFSSGYPELEVLYGGKYLRNSGFNFWDDRLQVLNGVAGRVPVRFLDSLDVEVEIQYSINKNMKIGAVILEIGFIPTQYMDKDHFIYEHGLAITVIVRETNEVRLIISYFGVSMKEERLSENKNGLTFVGKLILRKLKENISVYLKVDDSEGTYRERQARYFSTDLPDLPAPDGVYMHTFDNINNLEDVWPVFNVYTGSSANVIMSSKHFHEPSCNKNLYISENGQSVSNLKQEGFIKCGLKSGSVESKSTTFARSNRKLYSYNPLLLHKKYDISFELEFEKSIYSNEHPFPFEIRIESPENRFVLGVADVENHIFIAMFYGNSTPTFERIPHSSSHGLKKLHFSIEVNYELRTIKLDILHPAENQKYSHEFMNTVYTEKPYLYVGMRNTGIIEACFT